MVDEAESQQAAAAEADTAGVSGLIVTGGVRRFSAGMVLRQEVRGRELPSGSAIVVQKEGATLETARRLLQAGPANDATAATKALLAALDRGAEIDPAAWQSRREALLASPQRRAALESRRTSITKDRRE